MLFLSCRKNNDVNVSINSQDTNLLESSKLLESKEILVRSKQVHGMLHKCKRWYIYIYIKLNFNQKWDASLKSKQWNVKSLYSITDDIEDDVRIEKPDENVDTFNATSESINKNLQSFQYLVDNDENHDLEKSLRSMVTVNQMDEHDDS